MGARTGFYVGCGKNAERLARKTAKKMLREDNEGKFRLAKHSCPCCGFDQLLVTDARSIWCVSCGLMVPADSMHHLKSGRKVNF
jgi:ribosomal protein L32